MTVNNRTLLYSSVAVGVSLFLQLLGGLLGMLGMAFSLLSPLPVAFTVLTCGVGYGTAVVLGTTIGLLFLNGGALAVSGVYLLQYGIGGLALGALLRYRWRWDRAIMAALAVNAMLAALVLAVIAFAVQSGPLELIDGFVDREINTIGSVYQSADLPIDQQREVATMINRVAEVLRQIFPGLTVAVSGCVLLLTLYGLFLAARGRYIIVGPGFDQWKAPERAIWVLIASGFGAFFATGGLQIFALNLLTIFLPLYFMQGLAIVRCFFRRRNVPGFIQGISYVLILLLNPLPLVVTGFGIFDLWVDFRKPRIKET